MDTLTIQVTDAYRAKIETLQHHRLLQGRRCWISFAQLRSDTAEVSFAENGVILCYKTKDGREQKHCAYGGILCVWELREGILLELPKKRLLFLPLSDLREENRRLMDVRILLSARCRYILRRDNLRIPGATLGQRLALYRSRNKLLPLNVGGKTWRYSILTLIFAMVFIGGVFVWQLPNTPAISRQEAVTITAQYDHYKRSYGRHNREIALHFTDAGPQFVHGSCSGKELEERLKVLPAGTEMTVLVHPSSHDVLEIEAEGEILLAFDYAQTQLRNNAKGFLVFGVLMLAAAVYLVVALRRERT